MAARVVSRVSGALEAIPQLTRVDARRAVRGSWSLVHARVAQTVRRVVRLGLIDVVVAHHHLTQTGLVTTLGC